MHTSGRLQNNTHWLAGMAFFVIGGVLLAGLTVMMFVFTGVNKASISEWDRNRSMLPVSALLPDETVLDDAQEINQSPPVSEEVSFSASHLAPIVGLGMPNIEASLSPYNSTCSSDSGRLEYRTYPGALLAEPIPFRIYLPPCYDRTMENYPVIYLLHGKPMDESHWDDIGADEVAQLGIEQGMWNNFIVVMPRLPDPLFSGTDGGAVSYEGEMLSGLLPYVDANFRSQNDASGRFIAGISRGGVWALEIAFRHPELFNGVGALSPSLNVNFAREEYDPLYLATGDSKLPDHIYLRVGTRDAARHVTEELSMALDIREVEHTFMPVDGDINADTWREILFDLFGFCASAWN